MNAEHHYQALIKWTGNKGTGTESYRNYERSHTIEIPGKTTISGSSDPAFRGDSSKHNPEDLLVSSLSACLMLWYLHLCSEAKLIATEYVDNAIGIMVETSTGDRHFTAVTLNPIVTVLEESMIAKANERCFIANSVNFPIKQNATAKSKKRSEQI